MCLISGGGGHTFFALLFLKPVIPEIFGNNGCKPRERKGGRDGRRKTNLSTAEVGKFSSTQRRSSSAWEETGGVEGGFPTGRILTVSGETGTEDS